MTTSQITPLRRVPGFRNFWLSRTVSGLGSAITTVALPVLVFQESGSPLLVALVAASATLPYLAFGLIAGAVADRVDRRTLMVATDWLNALCLGSVPLAWALGGLTAGHVVVVAFLSATLALFFDAGVYGFVPDLVGKDGLARANSALYGAETVVRIAGNALAGGLIVLVRPAGTLALDALTFAVSALLLRAVTGVPPRPAPAAAERPGLKESVGQGLRFLAGHPTLRIMTVVGTLQSFSGGAIVGQLVVFADRVLGIHGSDGRIGLLYMAWSAGGIGGSLLLPRLRRRFDAFPLLLLVLPAGALLGLVVVLTTDWRVALVALTVWGTAYLVVLVNTMTYSQEVTPAELQGRVNTTRRMLSSGLGVPLGALVASTVTVNAGIRAGMATAVVAITLAAVLVWAVRLLGALGPAAPKE
ncbi:MFS transporter [Streptomyces sp. WAC06614]|uniref:MFS transporter n=1 Tax=Streptomyces sp. WAC06614 TaxID=2487416 RepID=UPI000F79943A|nr:MFS transporter [Streptomyces sp. WAC06614]RSS82235.1 MFS transporter [Streptomyces sp. WAC06614]